MIDLSKLYGRHARRFDAARTRSGMERPYLDRAVALVPPPGHVLELGCGTGEPIARYFLESGYVVTGVDFAPEMIQICSGRFLEMSGRLSDMRHLQLDLEFDLVIGWDSYFHLEPDVQREMFDTFRRHTRVGGVVMLTSGTAAAEEVGGDLFGDVLYHASLDSAEYAALFDAHGFRFVSHDVEDPNCGGHTIWMAQRMIEVDSHGS